MSDVCRGCNLPYSECTEEYECYTCPKCDKDYHMPEGEAFCNACSGMLVDFLDRKTTHLYCKAHDPDEYCTCEVSA